MVANKNFNSKIGVIGDVHTEASTLRSALAFFRDLELDAVLCTGDIVDGPESADACCSLLEENHVFTVLGNHDEWFLTNQLRDLPDATQVIDVKPRSLEYIHALPPTNEFSTPMGSLLLCHGIGPYNMRRITLDDYGYALESNFELQAVICSNRYRMMINGHTHQKMVRTIDGLTIVNAGSLMQYPTPCCLTVDFNKGLVQFYEIEGGINVSLGALISMNTIQDEKVYRD
jgi:putative phosphoesterase